MKRNGDDSKLTRTMLKGIAQTPALQEAILKFCRAHVVSNIEAHYLPDFKDLVNKQGKQLGRLPRYPNLTVHQLLALKPEGITDELLLPPALANNAQPAVFGQLDPQRPRKPEEVYLIPRPLLTSKVDGLFSGLVAVYRKLADNLSSSAQTYLRIAGGTYETIQNRALTLANDNAKYDICHNQILNLKAEFAKEFLGYALYKDKYSLYRTKIEELGREIDRLNLLANEDEKAIMADAAQSLENLFCLTYLQPFSDPKGNMHFVEGYFENNTLKQRYATSELALSHMEMLQNFIIDLKLVQSQLNKIDGNIHERMRMAELAKQAKEKPAPTPPVRKPSDDDVSETKLVLKRWQLPSATDVVSSSGSSSHSSKDSEGKNYIFKGINLGPDPIQIENADGFEAYFYLDTKALDAQDFNYQAFETLSRIIFVADEGQQGIKKISIPLKVRWSFNKHEQEPLLDADYELKVIGIADRILVAKIPGEGREVLYVGLVGLTGGLHNTARKERITAMLKNQIFEITSPFTAVTPTLQTLQL